MAIIPKILKDGHISYFVRVMDRYGKWLKGETFDRLVDAERRERQLKAEVDKGFVAPSDFLKSMTVGEYWQVWSSECRFNVSEGWKKVQNQMWRDYIAPFLSLLLLLDITPMHIGKILKCAEEKKKGSQTRLHIYNLCHKMFEDAVQFFDYLPQNPVKTKLKPKLRRIERNFLLPHESRKLLIHVKDHYLGPAIWLSLLAGLRPSEVQALRFEAINFGMNYFVIKAAFKCRVNRIEPYPKQEDWGMAPMPLELSRFLRELREGKKLTDFVAPGRYGEMLNFNVYSAGLKSFCRELGLREVTPHELRHSCTELYIEQGASEEDIMRLLNQKNSSVTRRYIHRTPERLARVAAQITVDEAKGPNDYEPTRKTTTGPLLKIVQIR